MPSREYAVDGDEGFIGLNSRDNPVNLGKGFVSKSQNMRMDRGVATVRKGSERLTSGALIGETVFGACSYTKADGTELIVLAVADGIYTYTPDTSSVSVKILFPGSVSGATYTSSGSSVTVTKVAHGLTTGTKVAITTSTGGYGGVFAITVLTPDTFAYSMLVSRASSTGTAYYNATNLIEAVDDVDMYQAKGIGYVYILRGFNKSVLRWNGSTSIDEPSTGTHHNYPPSRHAIYYGNRHIVQTDRNTISVSHYLQDDHWSALDVFTINDGSSDTLVAICPWTLNEFVIFMRNSIFYAAAGVGANSIGDPAQENDSYIKSLASDIGCIAKGSIVQAGGGIIFLSDNGVYILNPAGAGNGSGNTPEGMRLLTLAEPLSAPISDIISRINFNAVGKAVATYWENRYYLSVPLDDSLVNNVVLVYNFINKAWESVDTYPEDSSIEEPRTATFSTASYVSGGFINLQINREFHGLVVGERVNISFTDGFGGPTGITTKYPNGTYVVQSYPYNSGVFYIKIPYSDALAMPGGFYWGGNCIIASAQTFSFQDFVVAKRGNRRRMFMVNDTQGVFLLEELDIDEFGNAAGTPIIPFSLPATLSPLSFTPTPINGQLITRAYSFQTNREKRFSSTQVDAEFTAGSSMDISLLTVNPDSTTLLQSYGSGSNEDVTLRLPARKCGYYSQVEFNCKNLRPSIRSVTVEAIVPGHMTQTTK